MTTQATPGALGSNDQLGLAPERADIDWHGHGMAWALAESLSTARTDEWTTGDIARAFEAGARAAQRYERGRWKTALQTLADAADDVGVRYFDSDDPSDEVQAMQAATINAREVLRA